MVVFLADAACPAETIASLKRKLTKLKKLRTAALVGNETKYSVARIEAEIHMVREQMGRNEERDIIRKTEPTDSDCIQLLGITLMQYECTLIHQKTCGSVANTWGLSKESVAKWLEAEVALLEDVERKERLLASIGPAECNGEELTLAKYNALIEAGVKRQEIAVMLNIPITTIAYKERIWRAEGLNVCAPNVKVYTEEECLPLLRAGKKAREISELWNVPYSTVRGLVARTKKKYEL